MRSSPRHARPVTVTTADLPSRTPAQPD
jgi:hypothetical protein